MEKSAAFLRRSSSSSSAKLVGVLGLRLEIWEALEIVALRRRLDVDGGAVVVAERERPVRGD